MTTALHRWIPWSLVWLRLILAPLAVAMAWGNAARWLWLLQFSIAAASDVYDGRLARRWGTVTPGLRQADSIVDTVYWFAVATSVYLAEPQILLDHVSAIALLVGLEAARYGVDRTLFGRAASYHALSARLFAICLLVATVFIMGFGYAGPVLWTALAVGLYSEFEGLAISLVLPRWTHDVPHLGAAIAIRRAAITTGATP